MEDKLIRHGGIIFSAYAVSFFFSYVFYSYMARVLGPEDYGILGSMLSLLYIFSVPGIVITTTLTQIVSEQKRKGDYGKIKSVLLLSAKKLVIIGLAIFVLLILLSPIIKQALNLPSEIPVIFLGFSLIFISVLPSPRGVLQGMQEFTSLAFNMAIDKPVLLFFGILFIYSGIGVNGAILSYGAGALTVLIFALISLKTILGTESEEINVSVYKYAFPVFILILGITIMNSIDILFIRRFFPAEVSGQFTAMKMLGEGIYFLSLALGGVLIPKVSELNILEKDHGFLLRKALLYFGIFLVSVLFVFALAPKLIISILFGREYLSISGYLVWYGFVMALLSLSIIFMFYDVAAKRTAFRYPLILFTILDVALLFVFHSTIGQIIGVQAAVFFMLLVAVIMINRRYDNK